MCGFRDFPFNKVLIGGGLFRARYVYGRASDGNQPKETLNFVQKVNSGLRYPSVQSQFLEISAKTNFVNSKAV